MARSAARRYAEAIVSLARENNAFEAWDRDLGRLAAAFQDEQTARFLVNPGVPVESKRRAFDAILSGAQPEATNLVRVLTDNRRLQVIPEIYEVFTEAWLAEQGIVVAYVTTAEPLTPEDELVISARLEEMTGRQIQLRAKVDPNLIGGMIARVGDTVLDGSVQTRLRALRQRLSAVSA
jgi:F-type H+-transporting ATPase subunit delta